MTIGENIRKYRKLAKLTQKQLGELSGTSERTIQQYELEKRQPRIKQLEKVAKALDVNLFKLLRNMDRSEEMAAEHCPKEMIGKKYRHFKGGLYVVLEIALHTETETLMVIYKSLDNPSHVFARPLHIFLSKVDKKKYPDIIQELRFEEVSM